MLYFFLTKATAIFSRQNFNYNLLFVGTAGIATTESLYCITQYLGWFKSQNEFIAVTGSWNNPNVTAIFLALTVPVFLFLFQSKHKKLVLTGFITVLIALLLLKCRAALIGTVSSAVVFYSLEYKFLTWAKNKKNKGTVKALFILVLLIIIPVSSHLYNAKKASAEGRKFIWKVATIMASENPVVGYGYGYFEKEYNLYQANYIKNGKATPEELINAGPIIMPHNELLLNAVEGGGIGLALIVFFFGSLLCSVKQRQKTNQKVLPSQKTKTKTKTKTKNNLFNLSYAGIVAFTGMSLINSTIQMAPIMCMLVIYAAIISSTLEPIQLPTYLTFIENNKVISILSKTAIISVSIFLILVLFGIAVADNQNKKATLLKKEGQYEQALKIMHALKPYLNENSDYWKNYGSIYFEIHNYKATISCLNRAQKLSSLPELYIGYGLSYEKLKQYPLVVQNFEQLVLLNPSIFSYRHILMNGYLKNSDTLNAIKAAKEIIQLKPKIPSEKVFQFKFAAQKLIEKYSSSINKNKHLTQNKL